jgi:hypothetical protein
MTQAIGGDYLSEQLLLQLQHDQKINVTPPFKILRRRPVEVGRPAEIVLKKLQHVTKSFEHHAVLV